MRFRAYLTSIFFITNASVGIASWPSEGSATELGHDNALTSDEEREKEHVVTPVEYAPHLRPRRTVTNEEMHDAEQDAITVECASPLHEHTAVGNDEEHDATTVECVPHLHDTVGNDEEHVEEHDATTVECVPQLHDTVGNDEEHVEEHDSTAVECVPHLHDTVGNDKEHVDEHDATTTECVPHLHDTVGNDEEHVEEHDATTVECVPHLHDTVGNDKEHVEEHDATTAECVPHLHDTVGNDEEHVEEHDATTVECVLHPHDTVGNDKEHDATTVECVLHPHDTVGNDKEHVEEHDATTVECVPHLHDTVGNDEEHVEEHDAITVECAPHLGHSATVGNDEEHVEERDAITVECAPHLGHSATVGNDEEPDQTPIKCALWVEVPNQKVRTLKRWEAFYAGLARFVEGNSLGIEVTQLILRVLNPKFSTSNADDERVKLWSDPESSPMLTHLISVLPPTVELKFYPYLGEEPDAEAWAVYGRGSMFEGVFKLAAHWNSELARLGVQTRFDGIVLDALELEEIGVEVDPYEIARLKEMYAISEFSTLAGNNGESLDKFLPLFDNLYVVDIRYNPNLGNDDIAASVFEEMSAMTRSKWEDHGKRMFTMWSAEHSNQVADSLYGRPTKSQPGRLKLGDNTIQETRTFLRRAPNVFTNTRGQGLYQYDAFHRKWV